MRTVEPSSPPEALPALQRLPVALVTAVAVALLFLAGALALWVHYGTAVFFETIAAGIAACF
ncbi:hypothetical protein [Afipia sp. P52-10]|uniref:hypothetical protein n=1 Tax=Afipia sp. P52-10 TaxID=1429916 RepID=UPI00054E63A5|nr:hypothetical protein [Afipia sp. P52-10]